MDHPLVRYWQSTFSAWSCADHSLTFAIPGFGDPIMSASFEKVGAKAHYNFIGENPLPALNRYVLTKSFSLGTYKLAQTEHEHESVEIAISPLAHALMQKDFWLILSESFAKDIPYLHRLLPFLLKTNAKYTTAFIMKASAPVGLVNVGVSGQNALVLTAAIAPNFRGQGLCRDLVRIAKKVARADGAKTAIF